MEFSFRRLLSICFSAIFLLTGVAACSSAETESDDSFVADPDNSKQASSETETIPEAETFNGEPLSPQTAEVTINGEPLAPLQLTGGGLSDEQSDPTVGSKAPELIGTNFNDEEVAISADGKPKAIYFVAHWCPTCQQEIPAIQKLIDAGEVPENLDLYAVTTSTTNTQANYPPQVWLENENFVPPTIRDDEFSTAMAAFGGSSFPFVVYINAENKVVARSLGQLPSQDVVSIWQKTAEA